MGKLVRCITNDGSAFACALNSTDIVREIQRIHQSMPVITAALGRLASAASIMGYLLKGEKDTITLRMKGGGPAGSLIAVARSNGSVKAYVDNPAVELPLNSMGKLDVRGAVGTEGSLSVIRDLGLKEPYIGSVGLLGGEIAEDLAAYFVESEQIPTACALGVLVDRDQSVRAAGGYIIQLLPGAEEGVIAQVEQGVLSAGPVTALLDRNPDPEALLRTVLSGFDVELLESSPISYKCYCSRDRVERALISMGVEELEDLLAEQGGCELGCQFCDKVYRYTAGELKELIDRLKAQKA